MSTHPTSFADWQNYPSNIDPIHVSWLKNAKKSKTAFAVADIEGVEIPHKRFLTGVLLFSKKLQNIVLNKMLDFFYLVVVEVLLLQLLFWPLVRPL